MKKVLAVTTIALLTLGLVGGFSFALAHSGNSGSGSSGEGEIMELAEAEVAEFELKDDGEFRIKDATVTNIGTGTFWVLAQGITFAVSVTSATEFEGSDVTFADLMIGDIVDVKGMLDASNHHTILADQVEIEGLDEIEVEL